jgi:hypothetical protein
MTDDPMLQMALKPGDPLETEIWAQALVRFVVDGELDVPLLIPKEFLDQEEATP